MTNLVSLKFYGPPYSNDLCDDFISTFKNSLQQSSIEEVSLYLVCDFPFSVLDNGKNIKKLTLSDCTAMAEPVSSSGPPNQSLETLIICGDYDLDLISWATRRATHLTSLELHFVDDHDWTAFPELLSACSNSLTKLHLDVGNHCTLYLSIGFSHTYRLIGQSIYSFQHHSESHFLKDIPFSHYQIEGWIDDNQKFPFTLSALTCLKNLSIFANVHSYMVGPTVTGIHCALPAIVRLAKTAPSIQDVALSFNPRKSSDIASLGRLDWSPLDLLRSKFAGIRPRIDLCIDREAIGYMNSPRSILEALAENEALIDLMNRDVVNLKLEHPDGAGRF
jgi:hypothetical protein